jgi:3-hydroxyisobutyrate dehydrogenase
LAKELYALAAVHEHRFVEAPLDGLRILAAAEPDTLAAALPVLQALAPQVIDTGLPGSGTTLRLASLIALAGALMGLTEALAFALAADGGVQPEGGTDRILETLRHSAAASTVLDVFGAGILEEEFAPRTPNGFPTPVSAPCGYDLHLFFNDLTCALDAAEEFNLVLPGLETAHQLYDLLVLAGGGQKGIHALALIYCDRAQCVRHGLNWELAQRAMDVYERGDEDYEYDYDDDYDFEDDEDCDDLDCGHSHSHLHPHHHDSDGRPFIGGFFSPN